MGIIKKLAICGVIGLLSLSMVACGNEDTNTTDETVQTAAEGTLSAEDIKEDTPIAKVGDNEIVAATLSRQLEYQKMYIAMSYGEEFLTTENGKTYMNEMKNYIMDSLINTEIAKIKAEELKLIPKDEDVQTMYDEQKANFETEEEFQAALEESNMTEEELKEEVKTALITQNISEYMIKDVAVTDEEVEEYYKDNIAQYTTKPGATISHIILATEEEAKQVKAEYDGGASFADLAAKHNTDSTAATGGSLGYIEYDTQSYDQDFMAAAKELGEGEVSEPTKTQFGWHIIKAENIQKEDVVAEFETVKENASSALLSQKQNEVINTQLESWKEEIGFETYDDVIAAVE